MVKNTQPGFNVEDAEWSKKLILVLEEFRKINSDMSVNQMLAMVYIGMYPNISQQDLTKELRLDDGTVSRIVARLSDRGGGRAREGLNVINIEMDPSDYRKRFQNLTRKGVGAINTIRHLLTEK